MHVCMFACGYFISTDKHSIHYINIYIDIVTYIPMYIYKYIDIYVDIGS